MRIVKWNPRAWCAIIGFGVCLLLIYRLTQSSMMLHPKTDIPYMQTQHHKYESTKYVSANGHKLAIIIPFRDRFEELMEFVPHMHRFLTKANIMHRILVINQADKLRFNRASLINIGYHLSLPDCDYLAMHDVDLLPLNPALDYTYPKEHAFHVASPQLHPLYHYKTFVGGILILTHTNFLKLDGLSNRYWGWGREDDEFYVRMKEAKIKVLRPDLNIITTGDKTFRHIHDKIKRPRDYARIGNQKKEGGVRDRRTGVNTVKYNVTESYNLTIQGAPVSIYNVQLYCDLFDTPWCEYR